MRGFLFLTAAAALTLLAACANPNRPAPGFGDSVAAMHRAQTVPSDVTLEPPEGSGAAGALAQTRYQTGSTKPLLSSATSAANPSQR